MRTTHYTTGKGHGALCIIMEHDLYVTDGDTLIVTRDDLLQAAQRIWVSEREADVNCQDCLEWIHA